MTVPADVFDIDSSEHLWGEDCDCRPEPCERCEDGWVHSQGVYGGLVRICDRCGRPDANVPPTPCTPERLEYLRKRWGQ